MPLDHFSVAVPPSKLEGMVTFLTNSLQHMGFKEHVRFPTPVTVGMGDTRPYMWIFAVDPEEADEKTQLALLKRHHIAFTAESGSILLGFFLCFSN
jgi:hypothetical protein